MSERVKRLTPYVLTLRTLKPKQRKVLLGYCSKDQLRAIEEVALNIVKNNTPLTQSQLEVCKRWRKPLRMLALRRYPIKAKKNILQQGGFIGAILPVLASVLGAVIGNG